MRNKPFKYRKDFKDFNNTLIPYLNRLVVLFNKFSNINMEIYFKAPYVLYPDTEWFGLDFFASQKAIRTYTLYSKQLKIQKPDNPEQLEFIKKSLKFIANYCITNGITVKEYFYNKRGLMYEWCKHYVQNNISPYVIIGVPGIFDIINSESKDEIEMTLGSFWDNYVTMKGDYEHSVNAKNIVYNGLKLIIKYVENNKK
jgi:hypothetical protein